MDGSLLADAFGHHAWATLRLIDACLALPAEQLDTRVPGTYGSIIDTLRHLVGADVSYATVMGARGIEAIDEERMDLPALRTAMAAQGPAWAALLTGDLDPSAIVVRHRDDGTDSAAPLGIRLAQALHHGTDHRSQVCTALTVIGVEPPAIDVWDYAALDGRLVETPTPA